MMEKDIDQVIENFNNGDASSFRKIYDTYYPKVFGLTRSYLDLESAQDATATVFMKIWANRSNIQTKNHLEGFLLITTKNTCISALRRDNTRRNLAQKLSQLEQNDANYQFDLAVYRADLQVRIATELEKLPEKTRLICELAFIKGHKNAEIAKLLGLEEQTVRNMKAFALKKLRIAFEKQPFFAVVLVFLLRK